MPTSKGTLVLVNGTLIDGTDAEPLVDAALVTQGARIVAVGPRPDVSIPHDAQIIDVQGATILPGFINAHVHDAYDEHTLEAWAQGGVTTVRDLASGRPPDSLFVFRDEAFNHPEYARLFESIELVEVTR